MNNDGLAETQTATELARAAGVSKASAARFFRNLGYADFEEARLQAREERNRTEPWRHARLPDAEGRDAGTVGDHLAAELDAMTRTFEALRPDRLREAARTVHTAPRVWIDGDEDLGPLAAWGQRALGAIRPEVYPMPAGGHALRVAAAATGPRDAFLALSLGPGTPRLDALLAHARTTRMQVVAVTDRPEAAWVGRSAHHVLACRVAAAGGVASHTSVLSLLRLLAVALQACDPAAAARRREMLDAIGEELNVSE